MKDCIPLPAPREIAENVKPQNVDIQVDGQHSDQLHLSQ